MQHFFIYSYSKIYRCDETFLQKMRNYYRKRVSIMSTQEQAYKESLNELLDAFEKIEPVLQKAKQARKELSQDDYIKLLNLQI